MSTETKGKLIVPWMDVIIPIVIVSSIAALIRLNIELEKVKVEVCNVKSTVQKIEAKVENL